MTKVEQLQEKLVERFSSEIESLVCHVGQLTLEVPVEKLHSICQTLRDDEGFGFDELLDVCGVDYQDYGKSEWQTASATGSGFSRGVQSEAAESSEWNKPRFASVYHLLSTTNNWRLRIRVFVDESTMSVDSMVGIWASANWFEREAFDLFGIVYTGHPDLRRILTDYGFVGHPFRKDFPVSGEVEMRYDAKEGRVIYQPVSIEPRVLVPRVIRKDDRFESSATEEESHG